MIRNRKAKAEAMTLRLMVSKVLSAHTHLERLPDKEIRARLRNAASLAAVHRARRWVEDEYRKDKLAALYAWEYRARTTASPD